MVNAVELNYYSDILRCFKNLVLDLDMKYGIDSAHYASITQPGGLKLSKGAFQPIKIVNGLILAFGHSSTAQRRKIILRAGFIIFIPLMG